MSLQVVTLSYLLVAVAFALLAALLLRHSLPRRLSLALGSAFAVTSVWAGVEAAGGSGAWPGSVADVGRQWAWLVFLCLAYQRAAQPRGVNLLAAGMLAAFAIGVAVFGLEALRDPPLGPDGYSPLAPDGVSALGPAGHLTLTIFSLVLLESLLRHARGGESSTLLLGIGLGGVLGYDLFAWSEALLFRNPDPLLIEARGFVHLFSVPFLAVGVARNQLLDTRINLARRAVIHSAAFSVVGVYLLAVGVAGYVLSGWGGERGRFFQASLLFVAGMALAVVLFTPSIRVRARFLLGRYLFTHRHDYREQWLHFASALASSGEGGHLATRALASLAEVVGARSGGLWLRDGGDFELQAGIALPPGANDEPVDSGFSRWIRERGEESVLLPAGRQAPESVPTWLGSGTSAGRDWMAVPLRRRGLVGFVLLSHYRGEGSDLHREDAELLEIASRHVTSALLAEQRARRKAEDQRFDELSKGMAFLAHDLRNVANELTLTLTNARDHIEKPEFQRDLLLSMEESTASIQRLLDKVAMQRRVAETPPALTAVDLAAVVRRALRARQRSRARVLLELDAAAELPVACEADGLAALCGHLVQNALDAAGDGEVRVRLGRNERNAEEAVLEVEDDGPGMAPQELRDRMRHPFQSSKPGGFGLGLYECSELAGQFGGELQMQSAPGEGTTAVLRLPITEHDLALKRRNGSHGDG